MGERESLLVTYYVISQWRYTNGSKQLFETSCLCQRTREHLLLSISKHYHTRTCVNPVTVKFTAVLKIAEESVIECPNL